MPAAEVDLVGCDGVVAKCVPRAGSSFAEGERLLMDVIAIIVTSQICEFAPSRYRSRARLFS
jgi:hypothetical protein